MTHKFIFKERMQRLLLLFTAIFVSSYSTYAQSNYISIIGSNGCIGTADYDHRVNCAVSPSAPSIIAIPQVYDPWTYVFGPTGSGYSTTQMLYNSIYDMSGNLLFSANTDGIYDNTGAMAYPFANSTGLYYSPPDCSVDGANAYPFAAGSEIVIIPKPGNSSKYYAIFWCFNNNEPYHSLTSEVYLRAVEVDIDPSTHAYTFTDYFLAPGDCNEFHYFTYNQDGAGAGAFEVVANQPNPDNSVDIYTVHPDHAISGNFGTLLKWHIAADGTLPISSTAAYTTLSTADSGLMIPGTTKAKIFQMPNTDGCTDPVLAYVGMPAPLSNSYVMQTYNLNSGRHNVYDAPTSGGLNSAIWGFEYLPHCSSGRFCFSYGLSTGGGGLGYATPSSGNRTTNSISSISSTTNYDHSDLELDKNGDLLMVYDPLGTDGKLAFLPSTALTSVSSLSSTTPTIVNPACSLMSYYSVYNFMYQPVSPSVGFYLCSQNRNAPFTMPATYNVTASDTWTPTHNPVQAALGVSSLSTISANNIVISPNVTLTIQSMTVTMTPGSYVDVNNSTKSTIKGGRLILNGATLTHNITGCNTGNMWGGVRLHGNPGFAQTPMPTSPQSMITMENGAVIAYAHVGVSAGINFVTGGGICVATNSTFYNNNTAVRFWPFKNIIAGSTVEMRNMSSFSLCTFNSDDISTVTSIGCTGVLTDIMGYQVKGIGIGGCSFTNGVGRSVETYGIYGQQMGFSVGGYSTGTYGSSYIPNYFNHFYTGIVDQCSSASYTPSITGSIFNDNIVGANLNGCIAPLVTQNTFNVPSLTSFPAWFHYYLGTKQSIGLLLQGADLYSVYNNIFQPLTSRNYTVGVLAWNTAIANEENLVNNNTYNNLGVANLSNYVNYSGIPGLWFKCNSYTHNILDEAARGNTGTSHALNGIRTEQGVKLGNVYPYPGGPIYPNGIPSGNVFSVGSAYNLYSEPTETLPFEYFYTYAVGRSLLELPGLPGITASANYFTTLDSLPGADLCAISGLGMGGVGSTALTTVAGGSGLAGIMSPYFVPMPITISTTTDGVEGYLSTLGNVNYYMNDTNGIQHRDSLYYWFGQIHSGSADLARAYMLLEDRYPDSASALYHSIIAIDSLTGADSLEFATTGSKLFDAQRSMWSYFTNIDSAMAYAIAHSLDIDSLWANDSALWNHPVLDSASEDSLIGIFNTSQFWTRNKAENILFAFAPDTISAMLTAMPDTLLFPVDSAGEDSTGRRANNHSGSGTDIAGNGGAQSTLNNLQGVQNSIYPNPFNNTLQVTYQSLTDDAIIIKLDDVSGRQMIAQAIQSGSNSIDVSKLPPGMYLYRVYEGTILTMKGKIVKQ